MNYHQNLLSPIPEQHARRGRSRSARPLPILPPFSDTRDKKEVVNNQRKKYILAASEVRVNEESRHDEPHESLKLMRGGVDLERESTRMHCEEVLRSTIASWKEPKSRLIVSSSSPGDAQLPDIDTTPSDEKPFYERYTRYSVDADRSTRDQYQLSRLQARVHQRKVRPCNYAEENKLNLKHLRASRIKVVRGLYQSSKQEFDEDDSIVTTESDVSSVRDLTTLSSYRGKCYDKMIYLLNDVAPLEEAGVPCSLNDEGSSVSSNAKGKISVAELKLIKKAVPSKKHEVAVDVIAKIYPEVIHQPDTDTIVSKFSDVTSPTLHDGYELDEVPHFPLPTASTKNNVSGAVSNPQNDHLPSLPEESESTEDSPKSVGKAKEIEQHKTVDKNQEEDSPLKSVGTSIETKPAVKRVTFFEASKTKEIPQRHCCVIM